MKKILIVIAILILLSISLFSDEIRNDKINLIGEAEMSIINDQAHLDFTVEGFGSTLREAVENAKKKVTNISKELFQIGVQRDDLSTLDFFSGNNYKNKKFLSTKKDYRTEITTKISTDSLNILEEIILTLSDNKVENISNVNFTLSNYNEYKKECRELALKNAKEKADQISKELNITINGVYFVEELNENYEPFVDMDLVEFSGVRAGAFMTYEDSPINTNYRTFYSSKVTIKSIISVIFLFEN